MMHQHSDNLTLELAFFLGALHALEPGHGKTAMLVYLSGERRGVWHPIVMGLSSGLAHSVSLVAIALVVHLTHHIVVGDHYDNEAVTEILQWVSTLLILCVGGWMFWSASRPKPAKCGCGGHKHRGCDSASTSSRSSYSMSALLGAAFGLLPCPSAMAAYFSSMSSGAPVAAYAVIGLFAAGIATSLTCVGLLVQKYGDRLVHKDSKIARLPWPYVRASLILGIGVFYAVRIAMQA